MQCKTQTFTYDEIFFHFSCLQFCIQFPHTDALWRLCSTQLFKTFWQKEKLLIMSDFSFTAMLSTQCTKRYFHLKWVNIYVHSYLPQILSKGYTFVHIMVHFCVTYLSKETHRDNFFICLSVDQDQPEQSVQANPDRHILSQGDRDIEKWFLKQKIHRRRKVSAWISQTARHA